jgi:cold-inducible RNA-binding protein
VAGVAGGGGGAGSGGSSSFSGSMAGSVGGGMGMGMPSGGMPGAVGVRSGGDSSSRKLFVRGLAWDTTSESLHAAFRSYGFGPIEEAAVVPDKATGKSKGYGFVTYVSPESAARALEQPNKTIDGRGVTVSLASSGGPGVGSSMAGGGGMGMMMPGMGGFGYGMMPMAGMMMPGMMGGMPMMGGGGAGGAGGASGAGGMGGLGQW